MNQSEFGQWMGDCRARFPGKSTWLSRLESPQETLQVWAEVFTETKLQDALAASRVLWEASELEAVFDGIPVKVAREAKNQKARRIFREIDGENCHRELTDCPRCRGCGWISVWHTKTVAAIRRGVGYRYPYQVDVACDCDRGPTELTIKKFGDWSQVETVKYNPARHCLVEHHTNPHADIIPWLNYGSDHDYLSATPRMGAGPRGMGSQE